MSAAVLKFANPSAMTEVQRRAERTVLACISDPAVYREALAAGLSLADFGVAGNAKAFRLIEASYAQEPDLAPARQVLEQVDVDIEAELALMGAQSVEMVVAQLAAYRREREAREQGQRAIAAIQHGDMEAAQAHVERAQELTRGEPWCAPAPLHESGNLPAFPVDALPLWLGDYVRAESISTQTPADLPGMLVLAALSTIVQGKYRVRVREDWHEPTNLYVVVALPPGNRKSQVFRDVMEPIEDFARDLALQMAPEIATARSMQRIAEQRLASAEKAAARASGPERMIAEQDARDAAEALRLAEAAIPTTPLLICSDITSEAIPRKLAEGGGAATIATAEGIGPVSNISGRYSDGKVSASEILAAHAGDTIRVDRVNRPSVIVRDPALTLALTCQPNVIRQLVERPEIRELGLLARILWSVPESTVGCRLSSPPAMQSQVRAFYRTHMRLLLELRQRNDGDVQTLVMGAGARIATVRFLERIEPRLASGGDLEHVTDWAGKLPGAVARIAGLLHAAENAGGLLPAEIGEETVHRAIAIAEYLLQHALAVLRSVGADPIAIEAAHLLRWLVARKHRQIGRRDLYRGVRARFATPQAMGPALARLEEHGWIRVREVKAGGRAVRAMQIIDLNPAALVDRDRRASTSDASRTADFTDTGASDAEPNGHGTWAAEAAYEGHA